MEANSLWKFNLSNCGRFRLGRYPKVSAPKIEKICIQIKSPKGKIQNRLFLNSKKPDSICEEEWNPSLYSVRPFRYVFTFVLDKRKL